jgi:alkylation response protein AidB-like acyl-CoA dehydrogenase
VGFERELNDLIDLARSNGALDDPVLRDRLAAQSAEFEVLRVNAIRSLTAATPGADNVAKLVWANWHRRLGELAMDVLGIESVSFRQAQGPDEDAYKPNRWQNLYLFSRADTIYGGSDEVQKNILAERVLGLPKEPRP